MGDLSKIFILIINTIIVTIIIIFFYNLLNVNKFLLNSYLEKYLRVFRCLVPEIS